MKNNIKDLSFEDAMKELDVIVSKINSENISVNEMVALYERGVLLNNYCNSILDDTKGKIFKLSKDNDTLKIDEIK